MIIDDLSYWIIHVRERERFSSERNKDGDYSLKGFDELKAIFVHIPKCGGVSINKALFGNLGGGHKTVSDYKKIFGPLTYYRYYSFSFVRNPYKRLYSAFTFIKKGGFDERDAKWRDENFCNIDTFEEFVLDWLDRDKIWKKIHFYPQYYFICDRNDSIQVDYIGKLESFNEDFKKICNNLGVDANLKHHNKTKRSDSFSSKMNNDIRKKIYSLYKKDFQIFNYSF